jgi:putative N-acetylmannosamine-6-phosphate epimerase
MTLSEPALMAEVRDLIREGVLHDDPNSPTLFVVTVVGSQRSERTDDVREFVTNLGTKYPHAELVCGDTSNLEKEAAEAAKDMDLRVTVVGKSDKGEWDEGSALRDERVVAKATQIVAFDTSARSKNYQSLAKRMRVPFHTVK